MIDLKGKVAVVFGLANKRSIAWGIAQKLSEAGATLAICYQNERLKKEADALIPELKDAKAYPVRRLLRRRDRQPSSPSSKRPTEPFTSSSTPSPSRPPTRSRTTSSSPAAKTSASPTTSASTR